MRCTIRHGWYGLIYIALLFSGSAWAINPPAASPPLDCQADEQIFSSIQGKFRLFICTPVRPSDTDTKPFENMPQWGQLQFIHQDNNNQATITYWPIDLDRISSRVGGEGLQFWSDHLMTLDIGSERGGILYIANWNGERFVVSEYFYMTGDEDSMTLSWEPKGFLVDTIPDGVRLLVMQGNNEPKPGEFIQETLSCTIQSNDRPQPQHMLQLAVDTSGLVTSLSYQSSWTMAGTDPFRCHVHATRDDYETEWNDSDDGKTTIAINVEGTEDNDNASPANLDYVHVTRSNSNYKIRFNVDIALFCEASGIMAKELTLGKTIAQCLDVKM